MKNDVGDASQVKKRQTKADLKRLQETTELKELLADPRMRRFLWRLMSECGIYKNSFTGEVLQTMMNEGCRKIGLWVLTEIFASDKFIYGLMQNEERTDDD